MPFIRFTDRPGFRNPWVEFERIRQGLDELSRSYGEKGKTQIRANVFPALNVYEEADKLVVTAELPGIKPEDIDLSVEGETLTLSGRRESRREDGTVSYHRREIENGSFNRAITLPSKVDAAAVQANIADGILTITLAKAAEVAPRRSQVHAA